MGMIDKALQFCDNMAFGGTPAVVNLGDDFNPGAGVTLKGRLQGSGVTGMTALVINTGATSGTATTVVDTLACTAAQANAGFNFNLPITGMQQYVTVAFTGITAGTILDCSLNLNVQTA